MASQKQSVKVGVESRFRCSVCVLQYSTYLFWIFRGELKKEMGKLKILTIFHVRKVTWLKAIKKEKPGVNLSFQ